MGREARLAVFDELKTFALLGFALDGFSCMGTDKSKLDLDAAAAFLETAPRGCWTSYGDVAVAAGRGSNAAQGVVSWISSNGHRVANVHRVLNVRGKSRPQRHVKSVQNSTESIHIVGNSATSLGGDPAV